MFYSLFLFFFFSIPFCSRANEIRADGWMMEWDRFFFRWEVSPGFERILAWALI